VVLTYCFYCFFSAPCSARKKGLLELAAGLELAGEHGDSHGSESVSGAQRWGGAGGGGGCCGRLNF
jgi:hypothetical protein